MPRSWAVVPTRLPTIVRRCHTCSAASFRATGRFRVNANHKLLEAWLLARCARCGGTAKLTVLERVNVRSVRPDLLDRLHHDDPDLTAELLRDPVVRRRNRIALDWDNAWRLDTGGVDRWADEAIDISVHFAAPVPVRPVRLIAEGFGVSRTEVDKLIADGRLVSAVRLTGKRSSDFTFTVER